MWRISTARSLPGELEFAIKLEKAFFDALKLTSGVCVLNDSVVRYEEANSLQKVVRKVAWLRA